VVLNGMLKMSISFGMSEPYGNFLMARFRLKLKRILKKIVEFVRVLLPKRRKKIEFRVKVLGDVVHPKNTLLTVKVEGTKDFKKLLWLLLEEE
jgi:hypothetical protein